MKLGLLQFLSEICRISHLACVLQPASTAPQSCARSSLRYPPVPVRLCLRTTTLATGVRGVRDRTLHERATAQADQRVGLDEPSRSASDVTGDRHAAAQSPLCRNRRRARVRRSREARRLRTADLGGVVLPRAGRAGGSRAQHNAPAACAPGFSTPRLRTLRLLWSRPHRQVVENRRTAHPKCLFAKARPDPDFK